jgi:hypothetical protein
MNDELKLIDLGDATVETREAPGVDVLDDNYGIGRDALG